MPIPDDGAQEERQGPAKIREFEKNCDPVGCSAVPVKLSIDNIEEADNRTGIVGIAGSVSILVKNLKPSIKELGQHSDAQPNDTP